MIIFKIILYYSGILKISFADEHEKQLYKDLIKNYNILVRPCKKFYDVVNVTIDLKLSRILDIDEKNQIMTSDVWITQVWHDYRLIWNPSNYNYIRKFNMPVSNIWIPDLILQNNAQGLFELSPVTQAILFYNGTVLWRLPAILKSYCIINVEYFPFDIQNCFLIFSSWTYDTSQLYLTHLKAKAGQYEVENGIDITNFSQSDEWSLYHYGAKLSYPSNVKNKDGYYPRLKFCMFLKRKMLFYFVNLMIPCISMSFLSILVFLIPSDSNEKITLCISILLALTLFFLLLLDIMPPTSLVLPLLGKYLIFTMTMVSASICLSIYVLNIHHKSPVLHKNISKKIRKIFFEILPKVLIMKNFIIEHGNYKRDKRLLTISSFGKIEFLREVYQRNSLIQKELEKKFKYENSFEESGKIKKISSTKFLVKHKVLIGENLKALDFIIFSNQKDYRLKKIQHEWKLLACVLDRFFSTIFSIVFLIGVFYIYIQEVNLEPRLNQKKNC